MIAFWAAWLIAAWCLMRGHLAASYVISLALIVRAAVLVADALR